MSTFRLAWIKASLTLLAFIVSTALFSRSAFSEKLIVFAPASMSDVLTDIARSYEDQSGDEVVLSFAGTQQLARQLDAGAPANYFITADKQWMDWVQKRGRIDGESLKVIAGNRLVLAVRNEVENWADVNGLLTESRFAMAEPDSVPAGRYTKQALESRGIWEKAKAKAVFGENARITLRRLAMGEVTSAIVYGTDVAVEPDVKTLFVFPPVTHETIAYWGGYVPPDKSESALAFANFLSGDKAGAIFAKAGFLPPPDLKQ